MSTLHKLTTIIKKRKFFISNLIAFIFFCLIIYFVYSNWSDFRKLDIVNPQYVLLLAVFVVVSLFSTGRAMDVVLRPFGIKLHQLESYGLAVLSRMINQVTPGQTGLILRAGYLKKKHNLSTKSFLSALGGTHIFVYAVASIMGLMTLVCLRLQGTNIPTNYYLILLIIFTSMAIATVFPFKVKDRKNKIAQHVVDTINGWQVIKSNSTVLYNSIFWSSVLLIANAIMAFAAFNSLGANISLLGAAFITVIMMAGGLVSITPAGFGVNEALGVLGANGIGVDPHQALAAVLLQRVVVTAILYLTAPLVARWLLGDTLINIMRKYKSESSNNTK